MYIVICMEITKIQIEQAERMSLDWLCYSYQHGNGGFPHSRWMYLPDVIAWQKDYAETTGYFIENLLEFNTDSHEKTREMALSAGRWLLRMQSPEGYYNSGTGFDQDSAFNTAQILFGLDSLYRFTQEQAYLTALTQAYNYLCSGILNDGNVYKGLYVEGYYACYYTRMLWPMLLIDQRYFQSKNLKLLDKSLNYLFDKRNVAGFFDDTGFYKNKSSLLHTVAYTLEGFYECSKLTGCQDIRTEVIRILQQICEEIVMQKKTPAYISDDLKFDYSFVCVSGQAQLCSLLLKVNFDFKHSLFKKTAILLFNQLCFWQNKSNSKVCRGALPSSIPVWKPYFPFRYTHWTQKFFLDACSFMKKAL